MRRNRHVVVCLSGSGVGPELIAEASRTLHGVSRLHGFVVEDVHVPFGAEALTRAGNPLPLPTRSAYLEADAVLVADAHEPTLREVESELDLRAAVTRVHLDGGGFTLVTPLAADLEDWAVERAFRVARWSRGRVASIDQDGGWRRLLDDAAARHDTILVEHLSVAEGLRTIALRPEHFDVIVTGPLVAETAHSIALSFDLGPAIVASGRLAENGPSVFSPVDRDVPDVAGQGIVDPSSMLLAASLMLSEGLGERAAGETLAGALTAAHVDGTRHEDNGGAGVRATTRELADAVLGLLPRALRNAEFHPGFVH